MKNNYDFMPGRPGESSNQIIRPYCLVCENLMDEITAGNCEVFYICGICGSYNRPVFIDTSVIQR